VLKPGLNIIEGIYGRDGHLIRGPGEGGFANDYLTNIIIFGKITFHVDIIGTWLAGHEPGNFGLFHLTREKGFIATLNPRKIPVYEWFSDGTAIAKTLTDFERTPLKTHYLRRDYNDQDESEWHLVNEPSRFAHINPQHFR